MDKLGIIAKGLLALLMFGMAAFLIVDFIFIALCVLFDSHV